MPSHRTFPLEYPLKPRHIDADGLYAGSVLGASSSAKALVKYFQENNVWFPFTVEGVKIFLERTGESAEFTIRGLEDSGFIESIPGSDLYAVKHEFVATCFLESPKRVE